MFRMEYAILSNERNRLEQVQEIEIYQRQLDDIEGQIHIICKENEIGFVDETIPYEGEFLVTWLSRLNIGIVHLESNGYYAMLIPDSANIWLEFKMISNVVLISKIETLKEYKGAIMTKPIESTKIFWTDNIEKIELFQEIIKKTEEFIKEVYSINKLLVESRAMKGLINIFQMSKNNVYNNFD